MYKLFIWRMGLNISVLYLLLDMCYESFECADGMFCQKLDGEFQGVCIVADIEDNNISTGMVKSKIGNISKENLIIDCGCTNHLK